MSTMTKKTIRNHFLHEHPLELNDEMEEYEVTCCVCKQGISDWQHYRCSDDFCTTRIHEYPCSEIPFQIDHHPLHPHHSSLFASSGSLHPNRCDVCGNSLGEAFKYKCIDCPFMLDVKCALLTATATKKIQFQKQQQQQPNHSHPLILCDMVKSFDYTCCCCDLSIDGDCVYVCLQCKGLFHNSCAELPMEIEHHFHSSHPLVLSQSQPISLANLYSCSVCRQMLHRLNYVCSKCKFAVDVNCARLKPEQGQIQQFRHPHPLIFCNNKENFPYTCYVCLLPLADSIYFCPECPALLHKSCADLPQEIEHLLHPHHTLTLKNGWATEVGIPYCNACLRRCSRVFYKCCQCKWYMDVRCACLPEYTILRSSKIHRHPLVLMFVTKDNHLGCNICDKSFRTPFFRCLLCDFNQHVHCISALPPTLKYHNHVHSLTFTNCPIKDRPDEDDSAEFYCDACEERRDLALPTYYCKVGCQFVAHPHCVVSEIIQILEEEWPKHEKVEESLVLTLKEFLDSFTKDENKEVQGLFKAYIRDVRGESGILPKILNPDTGLGFEVGLYCAHLDKVSAWIVKKYVSRIEVTMPWGKWDTSSKVIKDGHYMILENHISILKALFSKYKDFSIGSRLSTKATMLFVMTVCEAIHSMCNTKVMDITTSLLLTWFHSFALAQYAGFKILFVTDHLTKLVRAHVGLQVGHDVLVDLNLAECNVQITKKHAGIDSKDIAIIEEDEETHYLRDKVDSMQLTIIKLDKAIEELENKKQALLKKCHVWCIKKECLIDALELKGQMAGTSLL